MHRPLLLALGLAAACTGRPTGDDTDSAATTDATTTGTTTTHDAPTTGPTTGEDSEGSTTEALAPCVEFSYRGDEPATWMLTCGLPELCSGGDRPVFTIGSTELLEPITVEVDDLERARCMVAALRDRTPGQFALYIAVGFDVIRAPLSLEIIGGRAILRSVRYPTELSEPAPDNVHERLYPLREPEFFADCVEGDAHALYMCLVDAVVPECLPGPLACPG